MARRPKTVTELPLYHQDRHAIVQEDYADQLAGVMAEALALTRSELLKSHHLAPGHLQRVETDLALIRKRVKQELYRRRRGGKVL